MNIVIDFFLLVFLVLIIWKIRIIKPVSDIREDYLSIESCTSLRGICAVTILFHHIAQIIKTEPLLHGYNFLGLFAVSVFFFLSGYGLQKSYMKYGEAYSRKFLRKRLPKILIPYVLMIALYSAVYVLNGDAVTLKNKLVGITEGVLIVRYSWYIIVCLLFYVAFGIMMKISKGKFGLMVVLGLLFWVFEVVLMRVIHFNLWWYNTIQITALGIFWATYSEKINSFLKKFYVPAVAVLGAIFVVSFYVINNYLGTIYTACTIVGSTAFAALIFIVLMKVKVGNRILDFLGKISLEIYLVQGLAFYIFRNDRINISNDGLFFALSVITAIAAAFVLNKLFTLILDKYKRLIK